MEITPKEVEAVRTMALRSTQDAERASISVDQAIGLLDGLPEVLRTQVQNMAGGVPLRELEDESAEWKERLAVIQDTVVEFMKANAGQFNDLAEAHDLDAGQPSQAAGQSAAMPKQKLDRLRFLRNFSRLWERPELLPFDVLVIVTPENYDDNVTKKSVAMSLWLFGALFTDVAVVLTRNGFVVIASTEVVEVLQQLCPQKDEDPLVEFIRHTSGDMLDLALFVEMVQRISKIGELQGQMRCGTLLQERQKSE